MLVKFEEIAAGGHDLSCPYSPLISFYFNCLLFYCSALLCLCCANHLIWISDIWFAFDEFVLFSIEMTKISPWHFFLEKEVVGKWTFIFLFSFSLSTTKNNLQLSKITIYSYLKCKFFFHRTVSYYTKGLSRPFFFLDSILTSHLKVEPRRAFIWITIFIGYGLNAYLPIKRKKNYYYCKFVLNFLI